MYFQPPKWVNFKRPHFLPDFRMKKMQDLKWSSVWEEVRLRVVLIYFWGELLFFANVLENTLWIKLVGTMIERPLCSSHQANQSSLKPPGVGDFEDPGIPSHVVLFSTSSYGLQRPKSRSLGRKKAGPNEGRRAEHDDRYWCKAICKRAFKTGMIHLEIYSLNGPPPLSSLQLSSIFIMIITKRFYQEVLDSLTRLS